jgi:hypothetical protein
MSTPAAPVPPPDSAAGSLAGSRADPELVDRRDDPGTQGGGVEADAGARVDLPFLGGEEVHVDCGDPALVERPRVAPSFA